MQVLVTRRKESQKINLVQISGLDSTRVFSDCASEAFWQEAPNLSFLLFPLTIFKQQPQTSANNT